MGNFRPFIVELALRGALTAASPERLTADPVDLDEVYRGMEVLLRSRPRYRWTRPVTTVPTPIEAPEGWRVTQLTNTGLYINGLPFKPADWGKTGRPIIRIQNLSGFSKEYNYTQGDFSEDNLAEAGDLLVSWSATLDTFVWDGPQGVVNQHIYKVIPNRVVITPEFLFWLLKHEVRQLARGQHAHGLAMMHINRGPFLSHEVLLPPIAEQKSIVAKVNELMTLCDQMDATQKERELQRDALRSVSLHRLTASQREAADVRFFLEQSPRLITKPEHVAAVRQTIMALALTGCLVRQLPDDGDAGGLLQEAAAARTQATGRRSSRTGKSEPPTVADYELPRIPSTWRWARLDEVAQIVGGVTKDSKNQMQPGLVEVPYLRVANVQRGYLDLARIATIRVPPGTAEDLRLLPGDILFNEGGDRDKLGRGWIWQGQIANCIHQNHVFRARLFAPIVEPRLVSWHGNSFGREWFIAGGKQTTNLASLNKTTLSAFPIPIPPRPQQHRIVAKVDALMAVCDELEAALASAQTERGDLLETLLFDALEGAAVPILVGSSLS